MSEAPRTDLAYLPFERRIQEVEKLSFPEFEAPNQR